jgi:uncharacterized protein YbbC (DUF1343 family)
LSPHSFILYISTMKLGIDVLTENTKLKSFLKSQRVALLAHPASVTGKLVHSFDALRLSNVKVSAAFGPQHGMKGDKQDNMIESPTEENSELGIPIYSLYGKARRPTHDMMQSFDTILIDLQDVGCRIYTYITTLIYVLEECAKYKKTVFVLDRPNPAGRPVEGLLLDMKWASFVGGAELAMRHGLTLGEIAAWYVAKRKLDVELKVIAMKNYTPDKSPGYGWPINELSWVNPSPNMPTLCTARCFAGTVLLEGTNLSEGRGTTRPLQIFGAPFINPTRVLKEMSRISKNATAGCLVRACHFEPTFHKFSGELCNGLQIHVDTKDYNHQKFKPYRLMLCFFKALRNIYPNDFAWRTPPYEYETTRGPFDLLNGSDKARLWVDDPSSTISDLEKILVPDEKKWRAETKKYLLY